MAIQRGADLVQDALGNTLISTRLEAARRDDMGEDYDFLDHPPPRSMYLNPINLFNMPPLLGCPARLKIKYEVCKRTANDLDSAS